MLTHAARAKGSGQSKPLVAARGARAKGSGESNRQGIVDSLPGCEATKPEVPRQLIVWSLSAKIEINYCLNSGSY